MVGGKIPYAIGMKDDSPFVFAGLWEGWKDPATDEWLRTCTIITGEANEFVFYLSSFGSFVHAKRPIPKRLTVFLGSKILAVTLFSPPLTLFEYPLNQVWRTFFASASR